MFPSKTQKNSFPGWKISKNTLKKTITLKNFNEVIALVNKIAKLAEEQNHHPNLRIFNYKNLEITLTTHETGGISDKDCELAQKINKFL